jgi:hypothetical protein
LYATIRDRKKEEVTFVAASQLGTKTWLFASGRICFADPYWVTSTPFFAILLRELLVKGGVSVSMATPSRKVSVMVTLSLVWAVSEGIHTHNADVERAEHFATFAYKVCTDGKALKHDADPASCEAERKKNLATWMDHSNANVAAAALIPIPFAWLTAFILLYFFRAQRIGFRAVVPWATFAALKKVFVVFCVLFSAAALLFGFVVIMNLYVDTNVPVALTPFVDVIATGDNLVTVSGTWMRPDLVGDTIMNPLQTSKIECSKAENRCTEALASVSGNTLMADVVNYDIQSWTQDAIVLRRDSLCATELFTIDLNTKAVSGAGHRNNDYPMLCKTETSDKAEWTYQLTNGFNIYWGLRQKARPLVLRVIQSTFGN